MSPSKVTPPPVVKHLLKRLGQPATPEGAHKILKEMKLRGDEAMTKSEAIAAAAAAAASSVATTSRNGDVTIGKSNNIVGAFGTTFSVTPWTQDVLDAANSLCHEVTLKRKDLAEAYVGGRAGKRGPSGRMDYRPSSELHPVICIDSRKASFLDDAFSLSPDTGELLVHIVDVSEYIRRYPSLQETAKDRISTTFLPSGPLHMMPPQLLETLKLSTKLPNEVITVAISVEADTGKLLGFRVFPSVVGPVFPIDVNTADELIAGIGKGSKLIGYPEAVVKDLLTAQQLVSKIIESEKWVDVSFSSIQSRSYSLDKRSGTYSTDWVDKTPCNRMINAMLTMYSHSAVKFVESANIDYPVAWENRDRVDNTRIRRFATQPLRNWLAQLQQKQLRSALKLELPMTRKDCALAVQHHNSKRRLLAGMQSKGQQQTSFEALEAYCNSRTSLRRTGGIVGANAVEKAADNDLVFNAEGLGEGGLVRIVGFNVQGLVKKASVAKGEVVKVRISNILPQTNSVELELV